MKFVVRTVVLLLIVNVLLVYMHYKQAGDTFAKGTESLTYDQEIEVINRTDALYIRHHFSGLSSGRHEIVWPEASVDRSCYLADATSCDRLDEEAFAFLDGENGRQSISYKIPKKGSMKQTALFKEPFVVLHGYSAESTLFHMTDETGIGGLWVNGLEQVGTKKMELVDYTLFRGWGEVYDLYWQRNELPLFYTGDKLSVFGVSGNIDGLEEVDQALQAVEANHSTVVIDKKNPTVESTRFIVSGNADVGKVTHSFLITSMNTRFSIPPKERMIAEVMASILGEKATGSDKSRIAYRKLTEAITAEELVRLKELINGKVGQEMDAAVLDELVGEATGFKTSYFTKNVHRETANYPFIIEDPRKIRFGGTEQPDIGVILKDGKVLYPAKKLLSLAGYTVKSNEQSIYIESDTRQFRFPKKELFYVYNERKYNVGEMPFEVLDGDFYFEESWLQRLFLLTIEKKADTIDIESISSQLREVTE